jgi:hypothetical protein
MQPLTKINLLKPPGSCLVEPSTKHRSGRCLCQDGTYISAYRLKCAARNRELILQRQHLNLSVFRNDLGW